MFPLGCGAPMPTPMPVMCSPNDFTFCTCMSGGGSMAGVKKCLRTGDAYSTCDCEPDYLSRVGRCSQCSGNEDCPREMACVRRECDGLQACEPIGQTVSSCVSIGLVRCSRP
ncbi:MAG: hypothetical protein Q8Q09_20595 [Deltaproteobacteria bacterium]|nr:hypothetical protein [Deltaproteobacteria bacterium]